MAQEETTSILLCAVICAQIRFFKGLLEKRRARIDLHKLYLVVHILNRCGRLISRKQDLLGLLAIIDLSKRNTCPDIKISLV